MIMMNRRIEEIFVRIRLKVLRKMTKKQMPIAMTRKMTAKPREHRASSSLVSSQSLVKLFWMKTIKNALKKIKCYSTRHFKKKAATI